MALSGDIDLAVDAAVSSASKPDSSSGSTPTTPQSSTPTSTATTTAGQSGVGAPATPSTSARVPPKTPTTTATPTAAIAQPVGSDKTNPAVPQESYPSQDKWPSVLDNARKKEAARIESEEYGVPIAEWKGTYKPHFDLMRSQGPVAYYQALGQQLREKGLLPADQPTTPTPAQTAQPVSPQPTVAADRPAPDLRAEDGRLAYSAEQMEKFIQWQFGKFEEKLGGRFKPVEDEIGAIVETRNKAQANEHAKSEVAEAMTWPYFAEVKDKVRELYQDKRRTLHSSYIEALKDYMPQVQSKTREGILKELQSTPAAPTTQAPSRVAAQINGNGKVKGRLTLDQTIDRELRARMSE